VAGVGRRPDHDGVGSGLVGDPAELGERVALGGDEGHGDPQLPGQLLGPAAHVVRGLAESLVPGGNEVGSAGASRRQRRHRGDVDGGHAGVLPARQAGRIRRGPQRGGGAIDADQDRLGPVGSQLEWAICA
jgi:hypothetical protein